MHAREPDRSHTPGPGQRRAPSTAAQRIATQGWIDPASLLALQLTAGNAAVGELLAQRQLPATQPAAPPGSGVLPPGVSTPDKIAVQLGDDYDFVKHPPADGGSGAPAPGADGGSGGTAPGTTGLPSALNRFASLWIKDMFTSLQILRVNGSKAEPGSRAPCDWLIAGAGSATSGARLATKAFSNPKAVTETDYNDAKSGGISDDQIREVKAFVGLGSWDDTAKGLPRKGGAGAGGLTDEQKDQVEYIRRRRAMVVEVAGLKASGAGLVYGGNKSADPTPAGSAGATPLQMQVWQELGAGEGGASAVNTWDDQLLTWGRGFSAKPANKLPEVVDAFFAADPGAREELMEAGFTHSGGQWLFVDLADGHVLEGNAALSSFRADRKFASLLAQVAEDPAHRQQFVDAQWNNVMSPGAAGDIPAAAQGWPVASVRFGAHCVWWGAATWGTVQAHGPGLPDLVRWIAGLKGSHTGGAVVVGTGPTGSIRSFALGAAQSLMAGPAPVPTPLVAGTIYFMKNKTEAWTF